MEDKDVPEERQKNRTDMVTLEGSPPNAEIYFWIHFKARRSFQIYMSVTTCTKIRQLELTVLEAEISYLRILDFFPGQETKSCETNSTRTPGSKNET
jgi:hypothetical protein